LALPVLDEFATLEALLRSQDAGNDGYVWKTLIEESDVARVPDPIAMDVYPMLAEIVVAIGQVRGMVALPPGATIELICDRVTRSMDALMPFVNLMEFIPPIAAMALFEQGGYDAKVSEYLEYPQSALGETLQLVMKGRQAQKRGEDEAKIARLFDRAVRSGEQCHSGYLFQALYYSGLHAKSTGWKERLSTCVARLEALRDGTNEESPQHPGSKFKLDDQFRDGTLKRYLDELRAD
jgi:hypothetical protein